MIEQNMSIDKFLEAVEQFCESIYKATEIFMGNPFDLIEMDLSKIPCNYYFVSDNCVDRGVMLYVKNDEFKRALYEFIEEHPDRVFRGNKF